MDIQNNKDQSEFNINLGLDLQTQDNIDENNHTQTKYLNNFNDKQIDFQLNNKLILLINDNNGNYLFNSDSSKLNYELFN